MSSKQKGVRLGSPIRPRMGLAVGLVVSLSVACGSSPLSPGSSGVVGKWHGVSVVQLSGDAQGFAREDITFEANGTARVLEYESPQRADAGSWSLSGTAIAIDFQSFCDRNGTVEGTRMRLTCVSGNKSWEVTYERQ